MINSYYLGINNFYRGNMRLIIPGTPIAKKRPRFARRGKFVTTYNDQETEESKFLFHVMQQVKEKLNGPVVVEVGFYFRRPKGHFGTGRNEGKLKASAPKYHTVKPDSDNLVKFAFDCLNEVAWKDDTQVVRHLAEKIYDDEPRTEIFIKAI